MFIDIPTTLSNRLAIIYFRLEGFTKICINHQSFLSIKTDVFKAPGILIVNLRLSFSSLCFTGKNNIKGWQYGTFISEAY